MLFFRLKKIKLALLLLVILVVLAVAVSGNKPGTAARGSLLDRTKSMFKRGPEQSAGLKADAALAESRQKLEQLAALKKQGEAALAEKNRQFEAGRQRVEEISAEANKLADQAVAAKKQADELAATAEKQGWLGTIKDKYFSQVFKTEADEILPECRQAGLATIADCDLHLRTKNVQLECKLAGLATAGECKQLLKERYGRPLACESLAEDKCDQLIDRLVLDDFVAPDAVRQAGAEVAPLSGRTLEFKTEAAGLAASTLDRGDTIPAERLQSLKNIFPLALGEASAKLYFHPSPVVDRLQVVAVPAVLQFDDDGDGLANEIERRLGTDPAKADSDNDGYDDRAEVLNGFNPLGSGAIIRPLRASERGLAAPTALEQPKLTGESNSGLEVKTVENVGKKKTAKLQLSGRALPNEIVSLFIYSTMPIVVSVETDQNGNWVYELDKSLVNGRHEAYLVLNDEQGRIKAKSEPFGFFINSAQAVTQADYLEADANLNDQTASLLGWYAAAGAAMIIFAVGLLYLSQRTKKKFRPNQYDGQK